MECHGIKVDDEDYKEDHEHLLLPWSCCVPVVLEKFSSSKAITITNKKLTMNSSMGKRLKVVKVHLK